AEKAQNVPSPRHHSSRTIIQALVPLRRFASVAAMVALSASCTAAPAAPPPTATIAPATAIPTQPSSTAVPTVAPTLVPATSTPVPPTPVPSPTTRPRASLRDAAQAALQGHTGTIGVVVQSLTTRETFNINADQ